jgi:DNA-binding beta-propeller fold protein YncE
MKASNGKGRAKNFILAGLASAALAIVALTAARAVAAKHTSQSATSGGRSVTPEGVNVADRVLGQINFNNDAENFVDASGLHLGDEARLAIDRSVTPNRIWVADKDNNRVLGWNNATGFTNGAAANIVLGQPDFNSRYCNDVTAPLSPSNLPPIPSASTLCGPEGVAVDAAGNVYVADTGNNRVLLMEVET